MSKAPLAYVVCKRILPPDMGYLNGPGNNPPYGNTGSPYV